jgi:hypothetical protein
MQRREYLVLRRRLIDNATMTAIAAEYGISRERVRQILRAAFHDRFGGDIEAARAAVSAPFPEAADPEALTEAVIARMARGEE